LEKDIIEKNGVSWNYIIEISKREVTINMNQNIILHFFGNTFLTPN